MSSIINLKKEILKVVLDSDGDLEKMNIYNIVKLSEEVKLLLQKEETNNELNIGRIFDKSFHETVANTSETTENLEEDIEFIDLKKINLDNLSEFEAESDTIFQRMKKAREQMNTSNCLNPNERREHIKQQLLNRLKI